MNLTIVRSSLKMTFLTILFGIRYVSILCAFRSLKKKMPVIKWGFLTKNDIKWVNLSINAVGEVSIFSFSISCNKN